MESAEKMLTFYNHLENIYDLKSRQYIKKNIERDINKSLDELNELDKWISDSRKGRIPLWKDELQERVVDLKNQVSSLDKPFRLFVIGTGKAGKSSVLNALIGQPVAAINFVAKTWKIDVFSDSEEKTAVIKYADGSESLYDIDSARKIVDSEERKAKDALKKVKQELLKIHRNKELIGAARRDAEKAIQRQYGYQTKIVEVEWPVSGSTILKKFTLVDTPGTDQKLAHRSVKNNEEDYFKKANGILWVIPEDMIAGNESHEAVLSLEKEYGRKIDSTIAIINKMDLVRKKDPEHGVTKILDESKRLYGKHFRAILPFEADNAYKAICSKDNIGMEKSGLTDLLKAIRDDFFISSSKQQIIDIQDNIDISKKNIRDITKNITAELDNKEKEYIRRKDSWKDIINDSKNQSIHELENLLSHTFSRIKKNAKYYEEKLYTLNEDERRSFAKENILEFDHFNQDINDFFNRMNKNIQLLIRINKNKMLFLEYENLPIYMQDESIIDSVIDLNEVINLDKKTPNNSNSIIFATLLGSISLSKVGSIFKETSHFFQKLIGNNPADKIIKEYQSILGGIQEKIIIDITDKYNVAEENLIKNEYNTFSIAYAPIEDISDITDKIISFQKSVDKISIKNISLVKIIKGES